MGSSKIEWTETTWNPVTGCDIVSPGCKNCYAKTFAERFRGVKGHPYEQGFDLKLWPDRLDLPLHWKKPRRIFVNSMSDLFHEGVPEEFIAKVFVTMARTPQHTYQILTKRPERMRDFYEDCRSLPPGILPNVWLGVSVENQTFADKRIPLLLQTPAAVRWISAEPLLGPVDLRGIQDSDGNTLDALTGDWGIEGRGHTGPRKEKLDWVVVGGESGLRARPFDIAWARQIIAQCKKANVPVFMKQLGANPVATIGDRTVPNSMKYDRGERALKNRKGGDPSEWPTDLRVREWPKQDKERT